MKKKLIANVCLFSTMIFFCCCEKDPPPDNSVPEVTILTVLQEITESVDVYTYPGASLCLEMPDGSYAFAYTLTEGAVPHLVNYSSEGVKNWDRIVGPSGFVTNGIDLLPGGDLILSIHNHNDQTTIIRRLTPSGDSVWSFNHYGDPMITDLEVLDNGTICFSTVRAKRGYLLRLNDAGDSLSGQWITDTMPKFQEASYVLATSDNGLITAHHFNDDQNGKFAYLTKTNNSGAQTWQRLLANVHFTDIQVLSDGNILCVSEGAHTSVLFFDYAGNQTDGWVNERTSQAAGITTTQSGNYLMGGIAMAYEFDANGTEKWHRWYYGDPDRTTIVCRSLTGKPDGSFVLFGYRAGLVSANPIILRFVTGD